jgi:hypothetical protein
MRSPFGGARVTMGTPWLSVTVWGNMPAPSYRVTVPAGRAALYEWAGPAFLALAAAAAGLWLARARTVRTGPARALLWLAAGCLSVSFAAWWVWSNRREGLIGPGMMSSAAATLPWLWLAVCLPAFFVSAWRRATRRWAAPDKAAPDSHSEPSDSPGRGGR